MDYRLEPSQEKWDTWTLQVLNFIRDFPFSLETTSQSDKILIPEEPITGGLPQILKQLAYGLKKATPTWEPGFMAYIPGGGIYSAALANFLGNLTNSYTGLESQAPILVSFENQVIQWFCRELGLPETAFGILTSGGSIANLTGVICGRVQVLGDTGDFSKARLYVSDQAHHSVQKAAFLAGIPRKNCVSVPSDQRFKLSIRHLVSQIEADRKAGFSPFLVVASAGTTNTGSIDPLEELAGLCKKEGLWFHVDAAYGGAFVLSRISHE